MCCCDCLLVAAVMDAHAEEMRQGRSATGAGPADPPRVSIDRVPTRLCGWSMLALLHRRWLGGRIEARST